MPFEFNFESAGGVQFSCDILSEQCACIKADGTRCRCVVCIGTPYCHMHLLHVKHLKVQQSNIPNAGKGLFAIDPKANDNAVLFATKENIIMYGGQLINNHELNRRYGVYTAPYAFKIAHDRYLDGACRRGIGSIVNTRSARFCNARFSVYTRGNQSTVTLKASRPIRNRQEIIVGYGADYDLHEEGCGHATRALRKAHLERYRYINAQG